MLLDMKSKIFSLCLCLVCLSSCLKDRGYVNWAGDKEIPSEGGSIEWTVKHKTEYTEINPIILYIFTATYDSEGNTISKTELQIDKDNQQKKYIGEWYQLEARTNLIRITFSPNESGLLRQLDIVFEGGSKIPDSICISQQSKP